VDVTVEGEVSDETGYLMDYGDMKRAISPLHDQLDHRCLNDIEGLENPTAEQLSRWIWDRLVPELPLLAEVNVRETCSNGCAYRGVE
jgi:6-pyruvoyltetrahydropterin/6-carboxytetrahydropterin synthase